MPRFHLHVRKADGSLTRDYEGAILRDLEAAEAEARETIRDLRRHFSSSATREWSIEIEGPGGQVLASVQASVVPD